ncbi:MAG: GNAT family N-acetyltransferase [Deltaproteobacteria bacterium]|nr:GNAT family N-acetyltransferase [Deltaproteobacteria bacterium]
MREKLATVLLEKSGIAYSILDPDELDEAARLVGSVFSAGSPVTRYLEVSAGDFTRFVRLLAPKFQEEGLSVVARDRETREMIGALLNEDPGAERPPGARTHEGAERMAPGGAPLEELNRRYFHGRVLEPNIYAHFFFLAVSPRYQGRRIAQHLVDLCERSARRRGYKEGVVEATNLISQHVFRKAGFSVRVEIPYAVFEHNGKRPLEGLKDHPSAMLMVKKWDS